MPSSDCVQFAVRCQLGTMPKHSRLSPASEFSPVDTCQSMGLQREVSGTQASCRPGRVQVVSLPQAVPSRQLLHLL